jgi:hypothetical protein
MSISFSTFCRSFENNDFLTISETTDKMNLIDKIIFKFVGEITMNNFNKIFKFICHLNNSSYPISKKLKFLIQIKFYHNNGKKELTKNISPSVFGFDGHFNPYYYELTATNNKLLKTNKWLNNIEFVDSMCETEEKITQAKKKQQNEFIKWSEEKGLNTMIEKKECINNFEVIEEEIEFKNDESFIIEDEKEIEI